ncbi:hypothetical protein E2C01_044861 [Portunus trituberculatus]|uniref:Uncharacterized protein n=1 Tax=Portunus trituberculatus TaxID=210409 RepID=A0A5B7G0A9_PORTR|nr:hypothetical protein [Portunus trituberculatus]
MELLRRTVEEGTVRLSKERLPHGKNPGTVHEQVQQQKGVQIWTVPQKRECILSPGSLIRKRSYIQGQMMSQCLGKHLPEETPTP